jgi:hypothetical protein
VNSAGLFREVCMARVRNCMRSSSSPATKSLVMIFLSTRRSFHYWMSKKMAIGNLQGCSLPAARVMEKDAVECVNNF